VIRIFVQRCLSKDKNVFNATNIVNKK